MEHLRGTLMHYPWGTFDTIHDLLGTEPDGRPVAEFWLGAYEVAPSELASGPLTDALATRPELLGSRSVDTFGPQLPFLMKVLSARHPLSLQAHPSRSAAEEGYAAEEAAGIPLTAPHRVYKDTWPKPEILIAMEEFHALCGFRSPQESIELFDALEVGPPMERIVRPLRARGGEAGLQEVFLQLLAMKEQQADIVDAVLAAAVTHRGKDTPLGAFARTALELDEAFPRDPGILAALLMNRITLTPGQGLYTQAGVMHAHLRGTGIEVMASSDNVIRGGLTTKHIAVDELVRVVDFRWGEPEVIEPIETSTGVFDYPTHCEEFDVWRIDLDASRSVSLPAPVGARIALVTDGELTFSDRERSLELAKGDAVFIPAANPPITATGAGQLFLASTGLV